LNDSMNIDGDNNLVANNILYENAAGGPFILPWGNVHTNMKIYNNTIYKNGASDGALYIPSGAQSGGVVNNISYANAGSDVRNEGSVTISNNLFGQDPRFVNPSTSDFHLTPDSPAINAGASLPEVPTDFECTSRPQGGAYDIGADEYGAGGLTPSPTPTPLPSGSVCTTYIYGSALPQGFAVPWDVTNPSIMLVSATCMGPTIILKAGNPNTTKTLYVYKTAYLAPSGAPSWTPIDLIGGPLISGAWYDKSAQGVTTISDTTKPLTMLRIPANGPGSNGCVDVEIKHVHRVIGNSKRCSSRGIAVPAESSSWRSRRGKFKVSRGRE
jgi:hypothetical protein